MNNNNGLKRVGRIIAIVVGGLTAIGIVLGAVWGIAIYAQGLENGIKENRDKDIEQDTIISDIESNVAYLVRQAQIKEIVDSLENFDRIKEAKEILENNNVGTDTFSTEDIGE